LKNLTITIGFIVLMLGIFLIFLMTNSANACNRDNSSGKDLGMSEIVILDSDQGKTIEAYRGDSIIIRLAENPATGYRWEISETDNHLVDFQSSDYLNPSKTVIGRGGTRIFRFKALSNGTDKIQIKLRRAWEFEDRSIKNFVVNILIR
jgi:inhibitor of cysteine peptidase